MSLSKPVYTFLGFYLEQLFNNPVRTKSITSCVLATSANLASQRLSGQKEIKLNTLCAYGGFGLLFGGPVPHYFYLMLEKLVSKDVKFRQYLIFLMERLTFAPLYQFLSLYFLARFEGHNHGYAIKNVDKLYWPLLKENWKWLSIATFINFKFVPPMFRVLMMNLVSFFWVIYISQKRQKLRDEQQKKTATS